MNDNFDKHLIDVIDKMTGEQILQIETLDLQYYLQNFIKIYNSNS